MSGTTANKNTRSSVVTGVPSGITPYVMIIAALVSAAIHLWLTPDVLNFDPSQAVLFVLAAVGFIIGITVYVTRYWRRKFYLLMALFALAQIVAYFVMGGPANTMAILSKAAEAIVVLTAIYLYTITEPSGSTAGSY